VSPQIQPAHCSFKRAFTEDLQTGDSSIERGLNLLSLNGKSSNQTVPHVINHCVRHADIISRRNNAVVNRVRYSAKNKYIILAEYETVHGSLRPDLVIVKNNTTTIIDITVPFENRLEALKQTRLNKLQKYDDFARTLRNSFSDIKVDAIFLGNLAPQERRGNEGYVLEKIYEVIQGVVREGTSTSSTLQESDKCQQVP
jgi:hypothetical protein